MPTFSDALLQVARQIASALDASAVGGLEAICIALLASALYEALKRELATADSPEARLLLEGAIERCQRAASVHPERRRDELNAVVTFLLGTAEPVPVAASRARFRVITGGLGNRAV